MAAYLLMGVNLQPPVERRRRQFRQRVNPMDFMSEVEFKSKFRLTKPLFELLLNRIEDTLTSPTMRGNPVPAAVKLACALRFYATGSFQKVMTDTSGVSQSSVSRHIHDVTEALCDLAPDVIKFPLDRPTQADTKADFHDISGFPNVLGAVDGTLIPIKAPADNEHLYVCRKGYHALNVQVVCDANYKFTNLIARWPGSTHDSFIWENSRISEMFEEGLARGNGWLLGDSGYPRKPHLLTPVAVPQTRGEDNYNRAHKSTRCEVERAIGILKSRFRCLHKSGGCLMYDPEFSVKIITACLVQHNLCIDNGIVFDDGEILEDDNDDENDEANYDNDGDMHDEAADRDDFMDGRRVREQLIRERFE